MKYQPSLTHNNPYQGTHRPIVRDSYWYTIGALAGVIMLNLLNLFLNANFTYASDYTLNLTMDTTTVDLNIAPRSTTGTFAKSNSNTISVSTTNATGYTLSIAAVDGTTAKDDNDYSKLISTKDNSKTLDSIAEATTEEQFKSLTGTAYNNKWGYLPSKWNSEDNNDFLPAPNTTGDILDITATANTTANEYKLTLGARVDTTTTLGSYTNVYLISAIVNPTPYTITYIDDIISGFPVDVQSTTMADTVIISSNTPTRPGYTFNGWCTKAPATNSTGTDTCPGITYQPGASLAISQTGGANDFALYAMWTELTLQTFANSMCSAQASDHDLTLKDIRDNKTYTVRYINGNCWMTQNLAFTGSTLDSTTSNIASTYTKANPLKLTWYDLVDPENATSAGHCYGEGYSDTSANGFKYTCMHAPSVADFAATSSLGYTSEQLGAWYNYAGATAGTITGASNTAEAVYDICPKGWKLPSRSQALTLYGYATGFNPVHGGTYYSTVHSSITTYGIWWTSTAKDASHRYHLGYTSSFYNDANHTNPAGFYVRCLADQ